MAVRLGVRRGLIGKGHKGALRPIEMLQNAFIVVVTCVYDFVKAIVKYT